MTWVRCKLRPGTLSSLHTLSFLNVFCFSTRVCWSFEFSVRVKVRVRNRVRKFFSRNATRGGVLFEREMFYVRALDCTFRRITVFSRRCLVPVYVVGYHSAIRRASTRDDNKRQFSVRGGGGGGGRPRRPDRRVAGPPPGPPRSAPPASAWRDWHRPGASLCVMVRTTSRVDRLWDGLVPPWCDQERDVLLLNSNTEKLCLSMSVCLSVFPSVCLYFLCCIYLLIFLLIWATSWDERFAFLVARHCALHCFVDIHFLLLHSWLNKLIDWLIDYSVCLCYVFIGEFSEPRNIRHRHAWDFDEQDGTAYHSR